MDDLISRQAAIDAINELHDKPNAWLDLAVDVLEKLPSAQQLCRTCFNRPDCPWSNTDNGYCRKWRGE